MDLGGLVSGVFPTHLFFTSVRRLPADFTEKIRRFERIIDLEAKEFWILKY